MTLSEAIKIHAAHEGLELNGKTSVGYVKMRRQFAMYMHNCDIEAVTDTHVANFFTLMLSCGWVSNTVVAYSTALKNLFKYWHRRDPKILDPFLIPQPKRQYKMPRIANDEEVEKVLAAIESYTGPYQIKGAKRDKALFLLLLDSGCRVGEAVSLKLSDIDLNAMKGRTKTEKARSLAPFREIYWSKRTNEALKDWLAVREGILKSANRMTELLFVSAMGRQIADCITPSSVSVQFRKYSRMAGLNTVVNPHSLRHRFGRMLAKKQVNNSNISTLLGHSHMDSSRIYTALESHEQEGLYRQIMGD